MCLFGFLLFKSQYSSYVITSRNCIKCFGSGQLFSSLYATDTFSLLLGGGCPLRCSYWIHKLCFLFCFFSNQIKFYFYGTFHTLKATQSASHRLKTTMIKHTNPPTPINTHRDTETNRHTHTHTNTQAQTHCTY